MKIAIYSRKSKLSSKGDSIGNQIQMCKDYIENLNRNKEIEYAIYEDEGFSGKNTNRPEFKKLLNDIKKEKFDILICYRLDRISRNVADFSSTLDELQAYGVDFVSIKEQFDTTSPMGRAMIYIASVFAQLERETIAERVRDNMIELAKNGYWLGGPPPFGYSSVREKYIDENGNEKSISYLVQVHEEIELINQVFNIYLKVGSVHQTFKYFMNNNINLPNGHYFSHSTLHTILTNPIHVKSSEAVVKVLEDQNINVYGTPDGVHGILVYNKRSYNLTKDGKRTTPFKDKSEWVASVSKRCKGFIEPDIWVKAQQQITANKSLAPNLGKTNRAILTSKLKCIHCGSTMGIFQGHRNEENGLRKIYYRCNLKRNSSGKLCSSKNLDGGKLEECVLNSLIEMAKNKKEFLARIQRLKKENNSSKSEKSKKANIQKQITLKTKQLNGLVEKLAIADDLADILMDKIRQIKNELQTLEYELNSVNENIQNDSSELFDSKFISAVLDKCINIKNEPLENQRRIINYLVDKIVYNNDEETLHVYPLGSSEDKKKQVFTIS